MRVFNSFQIVAAFAAGPFLIEWTVKKAIETQITVIWLTVPVIIAAYLGGILFMTETVNDYLDKYKL